MISRHAEHIMERIASAKHKADVLASRIDHHGLEGQIREIAIRECIEPFLTQSYKCSSGKIIDSLGNISSQTDVVVYHRKVAPPILVNQDLGLFPVECVRYAIEVKSTITAAEIRDANEKFTEIGKLIGFPMKSGDGIISGSKLISTIIFAFESDISSSELDRYLRHTNGVPPCVAICVLGKGYWFRQNDGTWLGSVTSNKEPKYTEFCMFMAGFMNSLAAEETAMRPFTPGSYVGMAPEFFEFEATTPTRPVTTASGLP